MKVSKYLFTPVLAVALLAGCTSKDSPHYKSVSLIFHQDQGDQDDIFTYIIGKTTYMEVKEFQDDIQINRRRGYDVGWEEYDLSTIKADYTINALYTLHNYVITYIYESRVIGTATYTINSTEVEEPPLPTTAGYVYHYEDYEFIGRAEDFTVRATRELATSYATFVDIDGNQIGEPVPFNIETTSIVEPEVPFIDGFDGVWEPYEFDHGDITVHPIYTTHYYYANFYTSSGELVESVPFTKDSTFIDEPAVPISEDYRDGVWQAYTLAREDIDIYPVYSNYHVFTAYFKQTKTDRNPVKVNYTYETRNQKLLDNEYGYTIYWKLDNVEYPSNEIYELPMHDVTFIKSRSVGHPHTITLNPNGGTLPGGDVINVTYGSAYSIPDPQYYSQYNGFLGWYTDENRTIETSGTWSIDEDIELSAKYGLSFEGDAVPEFITPLQNIKSLAISSEAATFGSKSLKITTTVPEGASAADYGVVFTKAYLDDTFSNPDIVAINFDAKGCYHTSNFRARIGGANTTYEQNNDAYGLESTWKKFSFKREYYEAYVNGDAMIYGRYSDNDYLYIDNVVPVTEDLTSLGFENGYLNTSTRQYMSAGHSNSQPAPEQIFKILPDSACTISNISFDYGDKTEGNRSFKFDKTNGYVALYLSAAIKTALGTNGSVKFDLKTTVAINSNPSVKNATDGMNQPLGGAGYQLVKNTWITIELSASSLTSDGRFLIIQGSTAGTMHFDNIRILPAN